ncbi:hypothetical protein D9613_011300 [Agrocybe pediades]|uniref:Uncharacterized protein n=1 Tax=Agrocybe pediades TaxID=84607 RepID=A0A8H4QSE4_9AGAR|nr:hypothetical protein D9613_011300 [Agrocybe pediades]
MELEPSLSIEEQATATREASTIRPSLLQELRKRILAIHKQIALLGHGVHGVLGVVETLPQLRVGKQLVGFVEQRHLGLRAAFVW